MVVVFDCVPALVVVAVIVSVSLAATFVVVTANVALFAPAATVTVAGTVTLALLDLRATDTDPVAATVAFRVTVPVEPVPPETDVGFTETAEINGGKTVVTFVAVEAPAVPVIVTLVDVATQVVEIGNV